MTNSFWGNIFKKQTEKDTINLLKTTPLFENLSTLDINRIYETFHLRTFKPQEIIFRDKEPGESLYIIKSGTVKICTKEGKKENELAKLQSGDFFGEVSLVDAAPRSATAVALDDVELLSFFRADLLRLIDRNPRLASFILLNLSIIIGKRLRENNQLVEKCKFHAT